MNFNIFIAFHQLHQPNLGLYPTNYLQKFYPRSSILQTSISIKTKP
nr:hypothetical protein pmam_275 [Pithovirus mammoth]